MFCHAFNIKDDAAFKFCFSLGLALGWGFVLVCCLSQLLFDYCFMILLFEYAVHYCELLK